MLKADWPLAESLHGVGIEPTTPRRAEERGQAINQSFSVNNCLLTDPF
jgi:hypothetical protein